MQQHLRPEPVLGAWDEKQQGCWGCRTPLLHQGGGVCSLAALPKHETVLCPCCKGGWCNQGWLYPCGSRLAPGLGCLTPYFAVLDGQLWGTWAKPGSGPLLCHSSSLSHFPSCLSLERQNSTLLQLLSSSVLPLRSSSPGVGTSFPFLALPGYQPQMRGSQKRTNPL